MVSAALPCAYKPSLSDVVPAGMEALNVCKRRLTVFEDFLMATECAARRC
jgi:hypothetical protein